MSSLCSVDPWWNKFQTGQRTGPHGQQVIGVWFKTSVTPKSSSHHPWKHPRLAICSCEKQSPCLFVVSCSLSLYLGPAFLKPLLYLFVCVCACVCAQICWCVYDMALMWNSEHNPQKSVLSLYHVCLREQTQGVRLGDNHLDPLSHLATQGLDCPAPLLWSSALYHHMRWET